MALSSLNGAAIYGTISTVYPNIRSAVFSSPTTLGQIVISSIVGNFTSYTITRNGGAESASQTAATYTDTSLANNTQYTYTIVPYIGGIKGVAFTTMTNPNNAGTPGKIYTLATITGLNPTYSGANSTISSVYITWTSNGYTSVLLANTTKGGANYTGSGTAYNSTMNGSSDSALTTNAQYTYTFTTRNGDAYYVANSNCQTTVNTCTWASAPTLTYNGGGCSTSQISFTFSGGAYTNLSVQYPSGTEITKTTTSPYTGGAFSANQQVTYYVYPINALSYISSNGSSVAVCTWASVNAPTFSSTTSAGTTLACTGTFSKVYITYTGTAATPASGTTVTGTNTISQGYTGVTAGTYAFSCYAVNALNYQSTTVASNSVVIPSAGPTIGVASKSTNSGATQTTNGAYTVFTYKSSGTFTVATGGTVGVLIVGGGGGGGGNLGGGAGAGGLVYFDLATKPMTLSAGAYAVTVGGGGAGGTGKTAYGANGGNSSFNGCIATGGGAAAYNNGYSMVIQGLNGGCGGGSASGGTVTTSTQSAYANASYVGGYGGGKGTAGTDSAGGGGGAGGVGASGTSTVSGAGGIGYSCSITGVATYYAGGGGGAFWSGYGAGAGGLGGGGKGALRHTVSPYTVTLGSAGTANTGGGGGGGYTTNGYNGGSGVVIILCTGV